SILNKPGKLTPEEYDLMKTHVERGLRVIEGVSYLEPAIPGILHHHERWDGDGYPNGLATDAISLEGRILSVVDAFDAMLGDRPYRKGRSPEAAVEELQRCAGTQFDPEVVAAFIRSREKGFRVHAPGIPLRRPSAKA
ncbi:MAG: HD-GYP domain-containing protein, partial [Gemmatimonadota bacterium]